MESSFRSDMQRKLRLQPPLSLVQSLTGPNESRRTSRESKDELIINSSLLEQKLGTKKIPGLVVCTCVIITEDKFELHTMHHLLRPAGQMRDCQLAGVVRCVKPKISSMSLCHVEVAHSMALRVQTPVPKN